jgi:hypothetical protein
MMMIDGEQSVNGRDSASARAAIRRALAKKSAVAIDVALALRPGSRARFHQGDEPVCRC